VKRSVLSLPVLAVLVGAVSPAAHAAGSLRGGVQGSSRAACADTALLVRAPAPPAVGTTGTVTVTDVASGAVADRIDLADPADGRRAIGGATNADGTLHSFNYYPVTVDGDTAQIHLHHALDYGRRYRVTIDSSVFGTPLSWIFRTRPAEGRTHKTITVSAAGRGDFCTLQGAIDAVPFGNTRPVTIRVAPGTYTELDWVPAGKPHITIRGSGAARTVVQYANNNTFNSKQAAGICPRQLIPGHDDNNCWRGSFNVEADDFTLRDITLHNTTPYGGSQAEAFRGNADRIRLERVRLLSFQDTLRLQGRGFVDRSYIEGDVDFTWGFGAVMIKNSELRSLHAGYVTQVRNDATHPGYVFLRDRLTAPASVAPGTVYLGRIDPTVYPYSQAFFIDTAMGPHIAPAGWLLNNADCTMGGNLRFGEYGSTDLAGVPLATANRLPCALRLTRAQAMRWSDPRTVLSGWNPERS
jgi:hypothetical protein